MFIHNEGFTRKTTIYNYTLINTHTHRDTLTHTTHTKTTPKSKSSSSSQIYLLINK